MTDQITLAGIVYDTRTKRGLTQSQVADRAGGYSKALVSKIENGGEVSIASARDVMSALEIKPAMIAKVLASMSETNPRKFSHQERAAIIFYSTVLENGATDRYLSAVVELSRTAETRALVQGMARATKQG